MIGRELAHFEITELLGKGGMGEVYRARDKSLGREVAIKILPPALAQDQQRMARFEREARLLASLNHPGIAGIHGLHQAEGMRFLSMEYVPGEDLAQRLARGPLPLDEALRAAAQIAQALEAAHERGVVHRDLKPANIIVGEDSVKILDFGLAKMLAAEDESAMTSDITNSPTLLAQSGLEGTILGTAAYMSPEQAKGKSVDRRTDIWAFGCVLYEMLTGKPAFPGDTASEVIGAVLHVQPDLNALPGDTPPGLRRLLMRCLEKDRAQRLRDAGDLLLFLEEIRRGGDQAAEPTGSRGSRSPLIPALVGLLLGLALAYGAFTLLRPESPQPTVRRFATAVDDLDRGMNVAVKPSPDGERIAYLQDGQLRVRHLDSLKPLTIPLPEKLQHSVMAWSSDGQWIAFERDKKLWKVPSTGGDPVSIGPLPESGSAIDASWGADGRIYFTAWRGSMWSMLAEGGTARMEIEIDPSQIVDFHTVQALPDGSLLYDIHYVQGYEEGEPGVWIRDPDGTQKLILAGGGIRGGNYSPTGHIVYTDNSSFGDARLMAVPFDLASHRVTGDPFRVADDAFGGRVGGNGLLFCTMQEGERRSQLVWVGRDGKVLETIGESMVGLGGPSLSPDGEEIAFYASLDGQRDIWVQHLASGNRQRLTFPPAKPTSDREETINWTPDGRTLIYTLNSDVEFQLFELAADGSGSPVALFEGGRDPSFSPDGRYLLYNKHLQDGRDELWIAERDAAGGFVGVTPRLFHQSGMEEDRPAISPDGRYVAYRGGSGDRREIYLTRFPSGEGRWQVSMGTGGHLPRWAPDGRHLYFSTDDQDFMEVAVDLSNGVSLAEPVKLFSETENELRARWSNYAVAADGRFLMVHELPQESTAVRSIVVVENWWLLGEKR